MQWNRICFTDLDAMELITPELRLVVVTQFGPRVAFLGRPDGENLLYWDPNNLHRDNWQLHGGHRLWITRPGADENEETYRPDNAAVSAESNGETLILTQPVDPINQVQRSLRIHPSGKKQLTLEHQIRNTGDMLYSGGIWALTCTLPRPGTNYGIPLGDGTDWDAATVVLFRKWGGHGCDSFDDAQFSFSRDMMMLRPEGRENKRMIQSRHGIIALSDSENNITFAKRALFQNGAQYPENTNIAIYVGPENFMVEMETMSPFAQLRPGESLVHCEDWVLSSGAVDLSNAAAVCSLFK